MSIWRKVFEEKYLKKSYETPLLIDKYAQVYNYEWIPSVSPKNLY